MEMSTEELELRDRLSLIENMIAEGRRNTESWGGFFVLWGVAYFVAIGWSAWTHSNYAWPVTMFTTLAVMFMMTSRQNGRSGKRGGQMAEPKAPETTVGRAIGALWIAMGISMFLLLLALGLSGRFDQHVFFAVVSAMLGLVNGASGMILRWKAQIVIGGVWWASAVGTCFGSENQSLIVFLVAIFICQIVFGTYGMVLEARERKQDAARGSGQDSGQAAHA